MSKKSASDLVADTILGREAKTIIVGGKAYFVKPPTIKKIAGAGAALSDIGMKDGNFGDVIKAFRDTEKAAKALSWFLVGDESLADELANGTLQEVVGGLTVAIGLLGIEDFRRLSDLSRSVRRLIANPK